MEAQLANIQAQETACDRKMTMIEDYEVKTLKGEAIDLTEEFNNFKEVESSMGSMLQLPEEDRFLGKNGDGNATYLRNVHGLASKSDVDQLTGTERRACLTYAAVFGAEFLESWVCKWDHPPMQPWMETMGVKPGTILCNNSISNQQAGDIMFHLYELSPVETPPESRMRRGRSRSHSRGRSESRGRKKPRLSTEALVKAVTLSVVKSLLDQLDQDETGSEGEE